MQQFPAYATKIEVVEENASLSFEVILAFEASYVKALKERRMVQDVSGSEDVSGIRYEVFAHILEEAEMCGKVFDEV